MMARCAQRARFRSTLDESCSYMQYRTTYCIIIPYEYMVPYVPYNIVHISIIIDLPVELTVVGTAVYTIEFHSTFTFHCRWAPLR